MLYKNNNQSGELKAHETEVCDNVSVNFYYLFTNNVLGNFTTELYNFYIRLNL